MENRDRFLLEQYIMQCWHVTDDVDVVMDYLEGVKMDAKDLDTLLNMLSGMKAIYNQRFDMTFRLFEELVRKGDIKNKWTDNGDF